MGTFTGKTGLVMGVANDRSIAWAISQALYRQGARLAFTHLPGISSERRVKKLVEPHGAELVMPCDVQRDEDVAGVFDAVAETCGKLDFLVHSIAFAQPSEFRNPYVQTSREGWHLAMDICAYSLVACTRAAVPLMTDGGAIVTVSYYGGEKVIPGYNVLGVCKAALEHSVRYLAWDLGRQKIRVNAISAGPIRTISSAGIAGFNVLRQRSLEKTPLARNVEPEDLGNTALYLLGDQSDGVTGETIHVDCGYSIVGL